MVYLARWRLVANYDRHKIDLDMIEHYGKDSNVPAFKIKIKILWISFLLTLMMSLILIW